MLEHIDIKIILEILSNSNKRIICFVGALHIHRVIECIRDEYDVIYDSGMRYNDGTKTEKLLDFQAKTLAGLVPLPIAVEDYDYIA